MEFVQINFFTQQHYSSECSLDLQNEQPYELQQLSDGQNSHSTNETEQTKDNQSYSAEIPKNKFSQKSKKSALHNMQKHLFTFVQSLIALQQINEEEMSQVQICVQQFLKILKSQKKKTKELLVPVFGEYNEKKLSQSNYSYLLDKYCRSSLIKAKEMIKTKMIEDMSPQRIDSYLAKTKVERKDDFKEYLNTFKQEVIQNTFNSRISSKYQKIIKNNSELYEVLSLN